MYHYKEYIEIDKGPVPAPSFLSWLFLAGTGDLWSAGYGVHRQSGIEKAIDLSEALPCFLTL